MRREEKNQEQAETEANKKENKGQGGGWGDHSTARVVSRTACAECHEESGRIPVPRTSSLLRPIAAVVSR